MENPRALWELRLELAAEVQKKRTIYLDQNFWNWLCDAALGATESVHQQLLSSLQTAVDRDAALCPIELYVYLELLKQRLPEKRSATARVIDRLSHGVVIIAPMDRVFIEALRFAAAAPKGPPFPPAPLNEIWSKVAFLLGHGQLEGAEIPADAMEALNRAFHTRLWSLGFEDLLEMMGPEAKYSWDWAPRTAEALNASKIDAREKFKSLRELYLSEIAGVLEAFAPALGNVLAYMYSRVDTDAPPIHNQEQIQAGLGYARVLAAAFEKHDLALQLPTVHVPALLAAHFQWDTARRYKANDFADFGHASAGVAYCNVLATERSLGALIRQTGLDRTYGCTVVTSAEELIREL